MTTEDDLRRVFNGLRLRSELSVVMDLVREQHALAYKATVAMLAKELVREKKNLAEFQFEQGKQSACLRLVKLMDEYAQEKEVRQTSRRPDADSA